MCNKIENISSFKIEVVQQKIVSYLEEIVKEWETLWEKALYFYRQRNNSITTSAFNKKTLAVIDAWEINLKNNRPFSIMNIGLLGKRVVLSLK